MSSEGISACLHGLADGVRSAGCSEYLAMLDGCSKEIGRGGVCNDAHLNGETAACLIQRMARESLSDACASALPVQEPKTGLRDKFWADGKRVLEDDEISTLNDEDHEDYKRWLKRKKAPKSGKDKERAYAVRSQKTAQANKRVTEAASAAARASLDAGDSKHMAKVVASNAAREEAEKAVAEDMTGTLKKFTDGAIKKIAADAMARATSGKEEL